MKARFARSGRAEVQLVVGAETEEEELLLRILVERSLSSGLRVGSHGDSETAGVVFSASFHAAKEAP